MRVGCISHDESVENLRVGGIYTVKEVTPAAYVILDDVGNRVVYPQTWFIRFSSDEQADLFEQYIEVQNEFKKIEERKNMLFQKLLDTGLQQGDVVYRVSLLKGLL